MVNKSIIGFTCACLAVVSFNVNAAITSVDWKVTGDNLITKDTVSGLEWLDLTATTFRSYNDISSQFGAGGEFEGWRYATAVEVGGFFDAFGGVGPYNGFSSTINNGLFEIIAPFWGDTGCFETTGCTQDGDGYSMFMTAGNPGQFHPDVGIIDDRITRTDKETTDYISLYYVSYGETWVLAGGGHALLRTSSVVPVPAAIFLFGSGLIGLIGVARRKKAYLNKR